MANFQISARRGSGQSRVFSFECASRQEAEAQVRILGWEPDPFVASSPQLAETAGGTGGLLAGVGRSKMLVMGGILGLILGTWLPVVSISAMGQSQGVNLWGGGALWPSVCIAAGVAAGLMAIMGSWRRVMWIAAAAGMALFIRMILLWSDLSDISHVMGGMSGMAESGGGPEAEMGKVMLQSMGITVSLGFGWLVLFGAVIAMFMGAWKTSQEEGGG